MTIDYKQPFNPSRDVSGMLEFLLWTTVTPGKKSETITPRFNALMEDQAKYDKSRHPAQSVIRSHGNRIRSLLKKHGIGQYNRLIQCWQTIEYGFVTEEHDDGTETELKINSRKFFKNATRDHLTMIPGIGLKTASFFIQNTRSKWEDIAVLDVHILRYLKERFPRYPVPDQTPQNREEYETLELMFLGCACKHDLPPRELDLFIWKQSTNN